MEEKNFEYKRVALRDAKYFNITVYLIALAIIGLIVVLVIQKNRMDRYESFLKNSYEKEFHSAVNYITEVNTLLNKRSVLEESSEEMKIIYANIWAKSQNAHDSISSLPYNSSDIGNLLTCLGQVSDLSYTMFLKAINNETIKTEEKNNLAKISGYISDLSSQINKQVIEQDLQGGGKWEEVMVYSSDSALENQNNDSILGSISNISNQFTEYPSLIYDGPFSEGALNKEARLLEGKEYISEEEAKIIGENFFGNIYDVVLMGESADVNKGEIEVYSYKGKMDKEDNSYNVFFDISKKGGYMVYMLSSKKFDGLDIIKKENLIEIGKEFLLAKGYGQMEYSYYEIYEDTITVNYAGKIGEYIVYPDLIKIKLNLYTGDIVGFESVGYIRSHYNRKIPVERYNEKELEKKLNKNFKIENVKTALIPTDINTEALCYEYKGKIENKDFLVYVNAETGFVEKIFQLIINDYGVLVD